MIKQFNSEKYLSKRWRPSACAPCDWESQQGFGVSKANSCYLDSWVGMLQLKESWKGRNGGRQGKLNHRLESMQKLWRSNEVSPLFSNLKRENCG